MLKQASYRPKRWSSLRRIRMGLVVSMSVAAASVFAWQQGAEGQRVKIAAAEGRADGAIAQLVESLARNEQLRADNATLRAANKTLRVDRDKLRTALGRELEHLLDTTRWALQIARTGAQHRVAHRQVHAVIERMRTFDGRDPVMLSRAYCGRVCLGSLIECLDHCMDRRRTTASEVHRRR